MKLTLKYLSQNHQLQIQRTKTVSQLRKQVKEIFELDLKGILLFYHGKILEDRFTLYDYNVKDNSAILVHFRAQVTEEPKKNVKEETATPVSEESPKVEQNKETDISEDDSSKTEKDTEAAIDPEIDLDAIPQEDCKECDNKETSDCSYCGCNVCLKKTDPDKQLICEECQMYFHIYCLPTPLDKIPEDDWYCHDCYNDPNSIIGAGKSIKARTYTKKREWDVGMACAGVSKKCSIVPSTHIGKIPGVPVGSWWEFRVQVAEFGIHRPPVAGIAGTSKNGSVSIVLAGGYEDDDDFGEEFYYTGSGGRDLSGNKRTAGQSSDQVLTKSNLTLAMNCDAPINTEKGATARDWKKSKPVRVVRNYKLNKHHPKYAPESGNRYDGLYKLVKYWPERRQHGFIVWRYHYRRDDDEPAPWTEEGKARIIELGLEPTPSETTATIKPKTGKRGKGRKSDDASDEEDSASDSDKSQPKIKRFTRTTSSTSTQKTEYEIPEETKQLISEDTENLRIWQDITNTPSNNIIEFLEKIKKEFNCPICFELVDKPITTKCTHNICSDCLKSSARNYGNKCPLCRTILFDEVEDVAKTKQISKLLNIIEHHTINANLDNILNKLFPTMRQQ